MGETMSDERRTRAEMILAAHYPHDVDAMLAFAAEEVAKERARCAKVCRDLYGQYGWGAAGRCAEAIEQEPT